MNKFIIFRENLTNIITSIGEVSTDVQLDAEITADGRRNSAKNSPPANWFDAENRLQKWEPDVKPETSVP
jgi:hypothetical protein